jgi:hypothetical protein
MRRKCWGGLNPRSGRKGNLAVRYNRYPTAATIFVPAVGGGSICVQFVHRVLRELADAGKRPAIIAL